jgi:hypothetical protein
MKVTQGEAELIAAPLSLRVPCLELFDTLAKIALEPTKVNDQAVKHFLILPACPRPQVALEEIQKVSFVSPGEIGLPEWA